MEKYMKYAVLITNFLVFILGCASLGIAIFVFVDESTFQNLIDKTEKTCKISGNENCDDVISSFGFYGNAKYIMLVISAVVIIFSFFGCCGAMFKNRCMLGSFAIIILVLFIMVGAGAAWVFSSGDPDDQIKKPLLSFMKRYNDQPSEGDKSAEAFKEVWNTLQEELKCCGVESVKDWADVEINFNFPQGFNKPEGCCRKKKDDEPLNDTEIEACRKSDEDGSSTQFYFEGCYSKNKETIDSYKTVVVLAASGLGALMFLNMVFAFCLCRMAKNDDEDDE